MSGLLERFTSAVKANPNGIAIIEGKRQYTFAELEADANGIAATLLNYSKGDVVGILLPKCEKYVATLLGIWKAGKTAVPLNHLLSVEELSHHIKESRLSTLIAAQSTRRLVDAINNQHVEAFEPFLAGTLILMADAPEVGVSGFNFDIPPIDHRNPALILYTSGMTGKPKAAVLSHRNIQASVDALERAFTFGELGRFLCLLPFSQTFAIAGAILLPLFKGSTMVIADGFNPTDTLRVIKSHEVGILMASPSMYAALASAEGEFHIHSLHYAISTSETLSATISEAFRQRFGEHLFDGYGQTEAGMLTLNVPYAHRPGSAGKPLPGVEMEIWDDWEDPVPCGQAGEIMVRSESVRERYLLLPIKSESTITKGWLHTGDIGIADADGFITIIERKDDLIISAGGTVSPREIEGVLAKHPAVQEVTVFGVKDANSVEVPKAFVIAREAAKPDVEELRLRCVEKLAHYKVPVVIEIVESLPRTPSGQVWKRMLPAMDQRRRQGWRYGL